jgi:hypothetical protein
MFLPPDTRSTTEWWIVMFLFKSMLSIRSEWGILMFILAILMLAMWGLWQLVLLTLRRLWDIYQTRSDMNTTSGRIVKAAVVALLILWLVAVGLASDPEMHGKAFLLFTGSLFAFTVTYEVTDWIEARKAERHHATLPEHISLKDVVAWRSEVEEADRVHA